MQVALTDAGRAQVAAVATSFAADVAAILTTLPSSERNALSALVSRVLVAHATARGIDLFAATS